MLLAKNGIIPPKEYNHNPNLFYQEYSNDQLIINSTVAMLLANNEKLPSK